jgi:translation initiation factor 4G
MNFLTFLFIFHQTGPTPALVKAEVPWSVQRGNLSEKERVLKTVKGYI